MWCRVGRLRGPARQFGKDIALDHIRPCFRQSSHGKAIPGLETRARRAPRYRPRASARGSRSRRHEHRCRRTRYAGRDHRTYRAARHAQPQSGLLFDPGAQADLEGAVRDRVKRAERQPGEPVAVAAGRGEDQRLIAFDGDDSGGQPISIGVSGFRSSGDGHGVQSRSTRNGRPSTSMLPDPFRRARAASGPRVPAPCPPG